MDNQKALMIVDKIFQMVFDRPNQFSLDELFLKLAKDMRLPHSVQDAITGDTAWSIAGPKQKFITQQNTVAFEQEKSWIKTRSSIKNLSVDEVLKIWSEINLISTERCFDSINVARSDPIYGCENAWQCADCHDCKNIVFTEGCANSEYLLASARSANCNFCIKADDSDNCSNSYHVVCSGKIMNSLFIQDCYDLYECLFCAHISSRKYCIGNIEFSQAEYNRLKPLVISYIFNRISI